MSSSSSSRSLRRPGDAAVRLSRVPYMPATISPVVNCQSDVGDIDTNQRTATYRDVHHLSLRSIVNFAPCRTLRDIRRAVSEAAEALMDLFSPNEAARQINLARTRWRCITNPRTVKI